MTVRESPSRFAFPEGPVDVRQWLRCVVRGHRWDPSPPGEPGYIACARCGMRVKAVGSD